jgi:hypothetical protein
MKLITRILCLLAISNLALGQAKKPTIMVVPSDVWCKKNGYMQVFDNQGTKQEVPDYKKALQSDIDLISVITKINGIMGERGFPLKNLESEIKRLEAESAEDALMQSKTSGSGISESPIDKLNKTAKADIIMQLTWNVIQTGPKKSITFVLQGLDSYTSKQIAEAQGTGMPSFTAEIPVLLEEAVISHMDNFNVRLQAHFDDMFTNGREVTLRVKKYESFDGDLSTEFNGKELSDIIEDWVRMNAVKNRFDAPTGGDNNLNIEGIRMPMYDNTGKALDAKGFFKPLNKMLKEPPYNIKNNLVVKGLGQSNIILGEK